MKIISSFILAQLLFFSFVSAGELQAELSLISETTRLKEGELVEGVLKIWPIENADLNEFKTIQNHTLLNSLYTVEIHSIGPSTNNADVILVRALFAVKNNKQDSLSSINYKGQLIPIQASSIEVIPLEKQGEDYFILDQSLGNSGWLKYFIAIIFALAAILSYWKRKEIGNFVRRFKFDPVAAATRKFNEKFLSAKTRSDYEEIYALRSEWLALIKEQVPAHQDFFETINKHQYKKNWDAEELAEIQGCFDVIRGSFK